MKTEYLNMETAIEWFSDFRDEVFREIDNYKNFCAENDPEYDGFHTTIDMKNLANFLFYVTNDKISIYGKNDESPDAMVKIDDTITEKIMFIDHYNGLHPNVYCLTHNYDYCDRYRSDVNYAVIKHYFTKDILYKEISVRYNEFIELIKELSITSDGHEIKVWEKYKK